MEQAMTLPSTAAQATPQSVLHVLPGLLTAAAFAALKLLATGMGYPPMLAYLMAIAFVDMPLLLGILLARPRKPAATGDDPNGRFGTISYVSTKEH